MNRRDPPDTIRRRPRQCRWTPGWGRPVDLDEASYFISEINLCVGPEPAMAQRRTRLFITISRMTSDAEYFGLPLDRTVIIGARIEI
ncbi:MAG: hypothetical protein WAP49_07260 [Mycobacterium sp.]